MKAFLLTDNGTRAGFPEIAGGGLVAGWGSMGPPYRGRFRYMLGSMLDFEIAPAELAARIGDASRGEVVLLDVREGWEFEAAKIEGSILMPMGEIPARVQELDPEAEIVTICHAGVRSMNVAIWLRNQGFERVQSLRGGIDAWSREIDPKVPRY